MPEDFKTKDWGDALMDLRGKKILLRLMPIELHHKSNGSRENEPSFCIIMAGNRLEHTPCVIGEISLKMLNEGMKELGYNIVKNETGG